MGLLKELNEASQGPRVSGEAVRAERRGKGEDYVTVLDHASNPRS